MTIPKNSKIIEFRHDILLIIGAALFIFFATGILGPQQTPTEPIILPQA